MSAGDRVHTHGLAVAVVGALAGGGLTAIATGQAWLRGPAVAGAPGGRISGTLAVPLALAAGLVGLAAAGGLLGTAGVARRILGALVAALAAAGAVATVLALARPAATYRGAVLETAGQGAGTAVGLTAWPFLALAGLLAVAAAGALAAARGGRWPALGRRYERRPGGRGRDGRPASAARAAGPAADWDALDAGWDPTDRDTTDRDPTDREVVDAPDRAASAGSDTVSTTGE